MSDYRYRVIVAGATAPFFAESVEKEPGWLTAFGSFRCTTAGSPAYLDDSGAVIPAAYTYAYTEPVERCWPADRIKHVDKLEGRDRA